MNQYAPLVSNNSISLNFGTKRWEAIWQDKIQTTLNHIIAEQSTKIETIIMPHEIETSYSVRLITLTRPSELDHLILPRIQLTVTYEDIERKTYKKYFLITSKLLYIPNTYTTDINVLEKKITLMIISEE